MRLRSPRRRGFTTRAFTTTTSVRTSGYRSREITPEVIGRWQADRLASGAGPVAIRHAMDLLGSILEHAFVGGQISANPARRVKKARSPRREKVQPLSSGTIEAVREALGARDATLISVLAYAGLRPGEALGLRWGDVREQTLLMRRATSLGEELDTKIRQHRTVGYRAIRRGSATSGCSGWRRRSSGLRSYAAVRSSWPSMHSFGPTANPPAKLSPEVAHRRPLDRRHNDSPRASARLERRDLPRRTRPRARNGPVWLDEPDPVRMYPFGTRGRVRRSRAPHSETRGSRFQTF